MKTAWITVFVCVFSTIPSCSEKTSVERSIRANLENVNAAFVLFDLDTDQKLVHNKTLAALRTTPCSTFKIWNTLIGAENHFLLSPDQPFYRWDGKVREIPDWNKDLTLSAAFKVSCVPAFQELARQTGLLRMERWINLLNYGNRDISSGVDDFWLPRKDKASIRISPLEQAALIRKLIRGELPFSERSRTLLFKLMLVQETANGKLYGKTGSGFAEGSGNIGWFVGFILSGTKRFAFACLLKSSDASGPIAKTLTIKIFKDSGLL